MQLESMKIDRMVKCGASNRRPHEDRSTNNRSYLQDEAPTYLHREVIHQARDGQNQTVAMSRSLALFCVVEMEQLLGGQSSQIAPAVHRPQSDEHP